jgi:predicted AlkP superfamily phosphohydrolase/phosphomutase
MTRREKRPLLASRLLPALACLVLAQVLPLEGYVGPGAGFAFLSSFLVIFLTFFMALFSLLSWPFRLLLRSLKGRKAYRRSLVRRLVILGFDGLEPTLVEKFMAEGKLPNFSRLRKEGYYSPLRTTVPAISPVAWSSFMTGVEPSKHNIFDFLDRDPRTYLPGLSSARVEPPRRSLALGKYRLPLSKPRVRGLRRSVPFWKILGENGIFSTVLRVPLTFPPEKFKGHLFSGMCAPDMKGSQGTFTLFTEDEARLRETEGGVAVLVKKEGNVVRTRIPGPENTMLKKPVEMTLPLEVELDDSEQSALIRAGGESFRLKERTFSPWVGLKFRPGLGLKVNAIARFYILSLRPKFEMYMTPLNIDPARPALPISHPFIYSVYLAKLLGSFVTLGEANDTWALNEGALDDRAFLELAYLNHADWEAMFENALEKTPRGLVTVVFETTDSIQHMFFRYLDRDHPALRLGRSREGTAAIEELYRRMDGLLGRVLAKLDDRSALFVMSDHGFKPFRRGVNLNSWLRLKGYLSLKPGCAESGEWFKEVDWEKTRAYALGLGGLYLNLKGREARGTVEPGESARKLKAEIAAGLETLTDPATGARAITKVYDSERVYSGPYRDNAPDLIIGYNIGYRASWDGVKGKVNDIVFEDNIRAWSGDHCIDTALVPGVLFSNLKLEAEKPAIIDIAPTALRLFGIEPPRHMDGRSLLGVPTDSQARAGTEKKRR